VSRTRAGYQGHAEEEYRDWIGWVRDEVVKRGGWICWGGDGDGGRGGEGRGEGRALIIYPFPPFSILNSLPRPPPSTSAF